jgi:hypothetical protein
LFSGIGSRDAGSSGRFSFCEVSRGAMGLSSKMGEFFLATIAGVLDSRVGAFDGRAGASRGIPRGLVFSSVGVGRSDTVMGSTCVDLTEGVCQNNNNKRAWMAKDAAKNRGKDVFR